MLLLTGDVVVQTRRQMATLLKRWEAKLTDPTLLPIEREWFETRIAAVRAREINEGL
jgi:hypothetical protein